MSKNEKSRCFQFIHLEAYSLKANTQGGKNKKFNEETKARTVREVLGEAIREAGFCNHVSDPESPEMLYGDLRDIEALCINYHKNHKNTDKNGKQKALRSDANVLLAGVISLENTEENIKNWSDYRNDCIKFLKKTYGDNLKAIIEHVDEENPHLHFYIVPNVGQRLDDLHAGKKAVLDLKAKKPKALKGEQNKTYIEAMRKFQDDFYNAVSLKYGLTKIGPARNRVSREIYFQQRKAAEEYKRVLESTKALERVGKNVGFNKALKEFRGKNYFQKMIFSLDFQNKKILELEGKNKVLKSKYKLVFRRKEHYKIELEKKEDFENKYINLRNDFNERVERKLEYKTKEVLKSQHELKQVKLENEYLKEELAELKEKAKYALAFMEKAKSYLGKKFESFKNDIFKKPDHHNQNTNTQKPKI